MTAPYPENATGGCLCGAIRYRAVGAPETVIYCHCASCRKHAGAPVVALAGYDGTQIVFTSGAPGHVVSSPGVARAFCRDCGTPLTWQGDDGHGGTIIELLVATMDNPQDFPPQAHIHTDERLTWFDTIDTLPRYRIWHDDGDPPAHDGSAAAKAQIDVVARYFTAVDGQDLKTILGLVTDDCVFSVETHGVRLTGKEQIASMFHRLWSNHAAVLHTDFRYVPDPAQNRISAQFRVENTEHDGSVTHKSNCNFFDISGDHFSSIAVYMAGPNTLDHG